MKLSDYWTTMTTDEQNHIKILNPTKVLNTYRVSGMICIQYLGKSVSGNVNMITQSYSRLDAIRKAESVMADVWFDDFDGKEKGATIDWSGIAGPLVEILLTSPGGDYWVEEE